MVHYDNCIMIIVLNIIIVMTSVLDSINFMPHVMMCVHPMDMGLECVNGQQSSFYSNELLTRK